jgi:hypothetical protein
MTEPEIVTDHRHPGWRARIIVDTGAGQPCGDALAPALLTERGHVAWASDVYQPQHAGRILHAWRRLDSEVFERYLRLVDGVTTIEQVTNRDLTVIIFDTADFRVHVGITCAADLTGERDEWRAWLDGDVYGVIVEHHTDRSCWSQHDALFGVCGWAYARQRAGELLSETAALTPAA